MFNVELEARLVSASLDRDAKVGRARLAKKLELPLAEDGPATTELSCLSDRGPLLSLDGAPNPMIEELPGFLERPDLSGGLSDSSPRGESRVVDLPARSLFFFHSGRAESPAGMAGPKTLLDVLVGDDFGLGSPLAILLGKAMGTGFGRPEGLLSLSSSTQSSEPDPPASAGLASLAELKVSASRAVERSSSRPLPASSFQRAVFFGVRPLT